VREEFLRLLNTDLIRHQEGQQGPTQIEMIVGRQLMDQPGASLEEVAAWWQGVQTEHPPGSALFTFLQEPLEALVFRLQLDPEVITVLRHYLARHHRFEAYTWLLGRALPEEKVDLLGASGTLDRRLEASEDLQQVRSMLREQDPLWPLERARIEVLVPPEGISPRRLLWNCRELFEERRRELSQPDTRPPLPPPRDSFRECWEAAFEEELQRPQPKVDEGVYADGLLRLLDIVQPLGTRGERSRIRDVDLLIERGPDRIGVAICHAEHMTSLAARLRRLIDVVQGGQLSRLLLIRDGRLPISPTATVTQERLRQLQEAGHRLIRPPNERPSASLRAPPFSGGRSSIPTRLMFWRSLTPLLQRWRNGTDNWRPTR